MFVAWGPERFFFYNDAYATILGTKHPSALGEKFENIWSDIWPDIEPIVKKVEGGEASYFEDLPLYMNRTGEFEQTYFTFSYSPVEDDTGKVVGLYCACIETTANVESRQRYKDLFDYSPLPKMVFDPESFQILEVNETAIKHYGYSRSEFLSMKVTDIKREQDLPEFKKSLASEFSEGVVRALGETHHIKKDGTLIDVEVSALEINFHGKHARLAAIVDVSAKKQNQLVQARLLAQAQAATDEIRDLQYRFERSAQATNLGIWYCDLPFDVLIWNDEVKRHFFLPPEEKVTIDLFYKIIHPDDREPTKNAIQKSIDTRSPYDTIYRTINPNNPTETKSIRAVGWTDYDKDGLPIRFDGITLDVTAQLKNRAELELAKEAAEKARKEAEHANELKSAFLANMSHEIRTPLGAMLGFADLLKDPGLTNSERQSFTDILSRNGESLSVIINDILDLSKVEAGHLTLEYTDTYPDQIGADVVSLLRVKAREKDLVLNYSHDKSSPESIVSDPTRVRQILLNLISNAIKFTPFGSVTLRSFACKTERGRNALCFEVTDTGIGISRQQQERIFEMFVQADGSMTRRFGGTGLGLALSRSLARAMGGDVVLTQSQEGVGSTFLVTIEDQPEMRNEKSVKLNRSSTDLQELPEKALEGLKILVVDDAPDNQQLIWRYLTKRGAIVESADNGLLGYRAALSGSFDLILMDIQMPVMDGYSATQKLRETGFQKPIIALTAHAMNEIRKKALNVGYTDHLTKPINSTELIKAIVKHVRH